jgi:biotin carboxylase
LKYSGKKLLVLGSTALTCEIIKHAQINGAFVMVTDYLEDSPGKKIADKSFMVSTHDVAGVVDLIRKEKIDGVLTGFIEMLLPYYQAICEEAHLPCYATKSQIEIATNKDKFKTLCASFDIPVVPGQILDLPLENQTIDKLQFPIVLKPVDSGGARGVFICRNKEDLIHHIPESLRYSIKNRIIVEKYISAEEVTIFYLIQDGEITLSAMADRIVKTEDVELIPLPRLYIYPSKHLKYYQETLDRNVIEMFESINVKNGIIFIQSFVENENFTFYEMGFRLSPTFEYKIISEFNGLNPLDMMINFALNGKMYPKSVRPLLNPNYSKFGFNSTHLVKPGEIGQISGLEEVRIQPNIIDVILSYDKGDIIPEDSRGTLKQVILRVIGKADSKAELIQTIDTITKNISVCSNQGKNLLLKGLKYQQLQILMKDY